MHHHRWSTWDGWAEFTVIAGGAAAALVGFLFVAVSIRAEAIARSRSLRSRLAQVLTIFLGILVACIFVSLPNPADWVLGVELLVTSAAISTALIIFGRRAESDRESDPLERVNPNVTTGVLIGLTGLALVFGLEAGLLLAGACCHRRLRRRRIRRLAGVGSAERMKLGWRFARSVGPGSVPACHGNRNPRRPSPTGLSLYRRSRPR